MGAVLIIAVMVWVLHHSEKEGIIKAFVWNIFWLVVLCGSEMAKSEEHLRSWNKSHMYSYYPFVEDMGLQNVVSQLHRFNKSGWLQHFNGFC